MLIHVAPDFFSYTRVALIILQVALFYLTFNKSLWLVIRLQH